MFHMLTTTEYAPVTDQDTLRRLLTRIAAGEREALAELYHCTRAAVYGLAPERAGRAGPHPGRLCAGVGPR